LDNDVLRVTGHALPKGLGHGRHEQRANLLVREQGVIGFRPFEIRRSEKPLPVCAIPFDAPRDTRSFVG
jgi:hypothetical protein